jgi:hypothetical protein
VGGKGGGGGRGEKWTKPCMHIWIIKEKWKKKFLDPILSSKSYMESTGNFRFKNINSAFQYFWGI